MNTRSENEKSIIETFVKIYKNKNMLLEYLKAFENDSLYQLMHYLKPITDYIDEQKLTNDELPKKEAHINVFKDMNIIFRELYNLRDNINEIDKVSETTIMQWCEYLYSNNQIENGKALHLYNTLHLNKNSLSYLPLLYQACKAKLITTNDRVIIEKFNLCRTEMYYYKIFYKLICDYPKLIYLNLTFTVIVKNNTKIRDFIENDINFKTILIQRIINRPLSVEMDDLSRKRRRLS